MGDTRAHWENIYATKTSEQISWTQSEPITSLGLIRGFNFPKNVPIIDVGGGESRLVDFLLDEGYTDITVLDISLQALENAKKRLGDKAAGVRWLACDLTNFRPARQYYIWHDRATFHFFTTPGQIAQYKNIASFAIPPGGYMVIGTFSDKGPAECSGLPVKQYTEETLGNTLAPHFQKIGCTAEIHTTPFQTTQDFIFCSFQRVDV